MITGYIKKCIYIIRTVDGLPTVELEHLNHIKKNCQTTGAEIECRVSTAFHEHYVCLNSRQIEAHALLK